MSADFFDVLVINMTVKMVILLSYVFSYSFGDPSTLVARNGTHTVVLLLYVDDIILTGSSSTLLHSFIQLLLHLFAMKDLGDLHYFLGIQVVRSSSDLFLSLDKYILDLLCKFQLRTVKLGKAPSAAGATLSLHDDELLTDRSQYRSMVWALQYWMMTRLDSTFVVHGVLVCACFPYDSPVCY